MPCSLCGAIGTNKTTCPLNKASKNPNPSRHNVPPAPTPGTPTSSSPLIPGSSPTPSTPGPYSPSSPRTPQPVIPGSPAVAPAPSLDTYDQYGRLPGYSNSYKYNGLIEDIHTYKIPKGSIFYHGSGKNITNFNTSAYFSQELNLSKIFILLIGNRLTNKTRRKKTHFVNPWLYEFKAKKDLYMYEHNWDRKTKHAAGWGDAASPIDSLTKADFCTYTGRHGWISFRNSAPLPLLFSETINYPEHKIQEEIDKLLDTTPINKYEAEIESGLWRFYNHFIERNSDVNRQFAYYNTSYFHMSGRGDMEFVFCNPNDTLELTRKVQLSYKAILEKGKDMVVNYLTRWRFMPIKDRFASMQQISNDIYATDFSDCCML